MSRARPAAAFALVVLLPVVSAAEEKKQSPVIPGYGEVYKVEGGDDVPKKGMKVVFDIAGNTKTGARANPALERAAEFYNLAGLYGVKSNDLQVAIILHGTATKAALSDAAYRARYEHVNPDADLLGKLIKAGAKVSVSGQTMVKDGHDPKNLVPGAKVAASALNALVARQSEGYAVIQVP